VRSSLRSRIRWGLRLLGPYFSIYPIMHLLAFGKPRGFFLQRPE
jgi:hypothetical protein